MQYAMCSWKRHGSTMEGCPVIHAEHFLEEQHRETSCQNASLKEIAELTIKRENLVHPVDMIDV